MWSRAHCSTSAVRQIGPIARRAIGRGKSLLVVYRLAALSTGAQRLCHVVCAPTAVTLYARRKRIPSMSRTASSAWI